MTTFPMRDPGKITSFTMRCMSFVNEFISIVTVSIKGSTIATSCRTVHIEVNQHIDVKAGENKMHSATLTHPNLRLAPRNFGNRHLCMALKKKIACTSVGWKWRISITIWQNSIKERQILSTIHTELVPIRYIVQYTWLDIHHNFTNC